MHVKRGLSLVQKEDILTGKGPQVFERMARTCSPQDERHVGILAICAAVARRATRACVVPSLQGPLLQALDLLRTHLRLSPSERAAQLPALNSARARCFQAAPAIEDATALAVGQAQGHLTRDSGQAAPETALDHHAAHVIDRYARLSAHHACAAACHALDAAATPALALEVLEDARGALSYQRTALGAARQVALRAAALDQAQWESSRLRAHQHADALAVQIFHEYLGGRYKTYVDSERLAQDQFICWALGDRLSATH